MNSIKIVRLNYGDDIIGKVDFQDDTLIIFHPMSIFVDFQQKTKLPCLKMKHWLPVYLVKDDNVVFNYDDILTVFEPKDEISEFYINFLLQEIKSDTKEISSNSDSFNSENLLMEYIFAKVENKIH